MDRSWESIYFISQLKRSHVYVEICSEQTADARHFEKNSQIYADEFDLRQVAFLKGPHSATETYFANLCERLRSHRNWPHPQSLEIFFVPWAPPVSCRGPSGRFILVRDAHPAGSGTPAELLPGRRDRPVQAHVLQHRLARLVVEILHHPVEPPLRQVIGKRSIGIHRTGLGIRRRHRATGLQDSQRRSAAATSVADHGGDSNE